MDTRVTPTLSPKRLEALLLQKQPLLKLTDEEVLAIITLLSQCSDAIRIKMMEGLHRESQVQILDRLSEVERTRFYEIYPDLTLLTLHFHRLATLDQERLLSHLSLNRPNAYAALKRSSPILKESSSQRPEQAIEEDFSTGLFSKLTLEISSSESALELAESFISTHKKNDILRVGKDVADRFLSSYSYIGNKDVFQRYLHVVHFLDRLVLAHSGLDRYLPDLISQLIRVMAVMEESWILPVLTQLPLRFAEKVIQQLLHYERLSDFEKRNMYCKLLNKIKSQARAENADYLRFLLSKG